MFESVIAEAERLAASGVREITLIGQDTTCYGEDLGLKDGLALLLERLAQIPDLRWVRFLYAYPNKITGKVAGDHCAARKDLFVHRCSSAARSASVLKRMKRGAGAEIFLKSIEKMRQHDPGPYVAHVFHRRLSRRNRRRFQCSFANSYRPRSSTGWGSSPTQTKKAHRPSHLGRIKFRTGPSKRVAAS